MSSRTFTDTQKAILLARAGYACERCKKPITHATCHADHVIPWSAGGPTTTTNGAALCARCNLKKGASMNLSKYHRLANRTWQKNCLAKALGVFLGRSSDRFFVAAAPGAGKTRAAVAITAALMDFDAIKQVIVISPRTKITEQWRDAFSAAGISVGGLGALNDYRPGGAVNLSITWASLGTKHELLRQIATSAPTLVIFDELHHAAELATWGDAATAAFGAAALKLKLSGTPFRKDGRIVWLDYDGDTVLIPEDNSFVVTYGEAVDVGYCRAVAFDMWSPGQIEIIDGASGDVEVVDGMAALTRKLAKNAVGAMLWWDVDDELARTNYTLYLEAAHRHLLKQREHVDEKAGGLVVCKNIAHAKRTAELLEDITGERPAVVHSGLLNANSIIDQFDTSSDMWMISVNMVSEGTDIPRLRVLAWASNVESELYFRQVIGRIVRKRDEPIGSKSDAVCLLPDYEPWREYALAIERECESVRLITGGFRNTETPVQADDAIPVVDLPRIVTCDLPVGPLTEEEAVADDATGGNGDVPVMRPSADAVRVFNAVRDGGVYRESDLPEEQLAEGERIRKKHIMSAKDSTARKMAAMLSPHGWYVLTHGYSKGDDACT